MKKSLKITGIVLAVLLAIMIIIPFAFQGKIKDLVKSEGNKMINGSFDFASLNISLFKNFPKASISLKDFWIKGANEFENDNTEDFFSKILKAICWSVLYHSIDPLRVIISSL